MQVLGFFFCKRTNTSVTVRERTATGSTDVEYQASIALGRGEDAGARVAGKHYLGEGRRRGHVWQASITWGRGRGRAMVG